MSSQFYPGVGTHLSRRLIMQKEKRVNSFPGVVIKLEGYENSKIRQYQFRFLYPVSDLIKTDMLTHTTFSVQSHAITFQL